MTSVGGMPLEPTLPASTLPPPKPRWRRALGRVGKWLLVAFLAYYVFAVVLLVAYRFVEPPITGVQLERRIEAAVARRKYDPGRTPIALETLPRHVSRAVIAAEDGRFPTHWGYDLEALWDAGREALAGQGMRGGSTITQQLVKNLFGCTCRNPLRKVYDLTLALPAHLILGRDRVLELYLNNAEWGPGIFGIEAAARRHYGTSARSLTRAQAAGLAALLPNPLRRTRRSTSEYRMEILRRMEHRGW